MGNIMTNKLPILSGPEFGPASGSSPKQLVILCHGLGADGNDLIGLAPYYAQVLPDAKFISPNAPNKCDMSPFGYQWFSLQERSEEAMLQGVQEAQPILDTFIDEQLIKYNSARNNRAQIGAAAIVALACALFTQVPHAWAHINLPCNRV